MIKIFGLKSSLSPLKEMLSDVIHSCVVDALSFPKEKRFHRFFPMEEGDFIFPADRSKSYTIIEISIFQGRTEEAKKKLIKLLFERIQSKLGIEPQDVEITIFETPKSNWGIRGKPGDELELSYKVEV